jgi:hypothetical protein
VVEEIGFFWEKFAVEIDHFLKMVERYYAIVRGAVATGG